MIAFTSLVLLCLSTLSSSLDPLPSFYHSSSNIRSTLSDWASDSLHILPTDSIDAIEIVSASASPRAFIVCGEHPRELISTETCLEFVRRVREMDLGTIRVVVNANPEAREQVEQGDYCLRTNLKGVDINRNWDSHWQPVDCVTHPLECAGREPMTEPQVLELRSLLLDFDPDVFVSVHSGSFSILTPYAYADVPPPESTLAMIAILKEISAAHTMCPVGPASHLLGYSCPGNILDYSYENTKATVTAAFEVYSNTGDLTSFLHQDGKENDCLQSFNPVTEEQYWAVLDMWTEALVDLIERV